MKLKSSTIWLLIFVLIIIAFVVFKNFFQNNKNIRSVPVFSSSFQVVKVVDGDTIDILMNNKVERIRFIGIDAPETVDPVKPVECFGPEATQKAKELLENKKVKLENDPTQGERDKYNRLLRYVFLEDDTNISKKMIEDGFAREYTYFNNSYQYQSDFKSAENTAKSNRLGLWSACYN